jgi:hypothetical protein
VPSPTHTSRLMIRLALSACWLLGTRWLPAQGAVEPPKLKELQSAYAGEIAAAAAPAAQKYREALLALERACTAQRDYTTAAAVRDERVKTEAKLTEWSKRAPTGVMARPYPGGPVTLNARDAAGSGGVVFNRDKDALEGWKSTGARAKWTLPFPLKAGGYEVVLEMACAPGSGGKVTIKEDFHTLTRTVVPTKGWSDFASQVLGSLRVKANATGLNLGAVTVEGDGLFLLRAVKLIPVSE